MITMILECSNCGHTFDEPITTVGIDCPGCGTYHIIPSRIDCERMKQNLDALNTSD